MPCRIRILSSSVGIALLASVVLLESARADSNRASEDQRLELVRGLTAEFATVKTYLPRSKKALDFDSDGTWDQAKWQAAGQEFGPAARVGDLIEITHVSIKKDAIVLELNNGMKGPGSHWYDRIQIGMGGPTGGPVQNRPTPAPGGTTIRVRFDGGIGSVNSAEVKKLLAPVLDFEKHSVTETYVSQLPPEIKKAVKEKRAVKGMDEDTVLVALGHPNRKSREFKDGQETEDWIYGEPPGKVTFVTFSGGKVIQVRDAYADFGGSVAHIPTQQQ